MTNDFVHDHARSSTRRPTVAHSLLRWVCAAIVGALSCGGEPPPADGVARTEGEIINGTPATGNTTMVALYHKAINDTTCGGAPFTGWWPRPCSSSVLKRTTTETFVLTARHCVTSDGNINGPLLGAGSLLLSGALAPGPVPTGGTPPADALPGVVFAAGNPTSAGDRSQDLAIVRVAQQVVIPSTPSAGNGIFFTNPGASIVGLGLVAYGYGRNVTGDCDGDQSSGAGVLRLGGPYNISSDFGNFYQIPATDTSGRELWHGDSGGPSYFFSPSSGNAYLTGVHSGFDTSTILAESGGNALAPWLQSKLGNLYLRNVAQSFTVGALVGVTSVVSGAHLTATLAKESAGARFVYNTSTMRISIGSLCAQDQGSNASVSLAGCSSSTLQRWTLNSNAQVVNQGSGRCLTLSGTNLVSSTCGTVRLANQWLWMTEPQPCNQCLVGGTSQGSCVPSCGQTICAEDPFCCNNSWDSVCVGEVSSICGMTCP